MYSPDGYHDYLLKQKHPMEFDASKPFESQSKAIREKVLECLGTMPDKIVPANPVIEETTEHETYMEYRIRFDVEEYVQAICILCIPRKALDNPGVKVPLAICLQGHGTGMHVSMHRAKWPSDHPQDGDRDCAIQALERGYAALSLDQRGMGERRTEKSGYGEDTGSPRCRTTAMNAIMLGKTLLGERCWDVSRAIDLALTYPQIDPERILCTGNSGGGTATYYAAMYDERIKVAMPSCSVCTYRDSIGAMLHCECNYIPNIAKYMEMGDVAAAIAPRGLVVISGAQDRIFPKAGVEEVCERIAEIYKAAGVPEKFVHKEGPEGHRYYKTKAWEGFEEVTGGNWD